MLSEEETVPPPAESGALERISAYFLKFKASVWDFYNCSRIMSVASSGPVWLLGKRFDSTLEEPEYAMTERFTSRLWFTYRTGFPPLAGMTSDVGWGCMLRSGQCLIGQALVELFLGRDWPNQWQTFSIQHPDYPQYKQILNQFLDHKNARFSVHSIAEHGLKYDKAIGQWFGPTSLANALRDIETCTDKPDVAIYVCDGGTLYSELAFEAATVHGTDWKPLVILAPLRLGIEGLNPIYIKALTSCFESENCIGMAGGRPNSSLYFIGTDGSRLMYLDPHETRPYSPNIDEDYQSYHCDTIRLVEVKSIDPSVLIGFLCKSREEFDHTLFFLRKDEKSPGAIIHVGDRPPEDIDLDDAEDEFEL